MSYDSQCYDLAEAFLSDSDLDPKTYAPELAQEIQDVIEDYIRNLEEAATGDHLQRRTVH